MIHIDIGHSYLDNGITRICEGGVTVGFAFALFNYGIAIWLS